jgi:hypothetical protein
MQVGEGLGDRICWQRPRQDLAAPGLGRGRARISGAGSFGADADLVPTSGALVGGDPVEVVRERGDRP